MNDLSAIYTIENVGLSDCYHGEKISCITFYAILEIPVI